MLPTFILYMSYSTTDLKQSAMLKWIRTDSTQHARSKIMTDKEKRKKTNEGF